MKTTTITSTKAAGDGIRAKALITYALIVLISVELGCQFAFRLLEHRWIFVEASGRIPRIFDRHPYLVGAPTPKIDETLFGTRILHNSLGFRGPEVKLQKAPGVTRIVTLGASTTYCTGVAEGQTWPELLAKELGNGYEVINLGVPGYGTVENLIQAAFLISDLAPNIAVYYEGWSDIRNMHIKNLKADYSNFHPRALYQSLRLGPSAPSEAIATVHYLRQILMKSHEVDPLSTFVIEGDGDQLTDKIDHRALDLYTRNLRSIIGLNRSMGIVPVLIPQLLNFDALTADFPYGWLPYVKDRDLKAGMAAYNDGMRKVAEEQHADFVGEVLQMPFGNSDFWDNGHFNQSGTAKFAKIIALYILAHDHLRKTAATQTGEAQQNTRATRFEALFADAMTRMGAGDHAGAVERFRKGIDAMPGKDRTADAWNNMGWSLQQLGRYGEAVEAYHKALQLRPAFVLARNNLNAVQQRLDLEKTSKERRPAATGR